MFSVKFKMVDGKEKRRYRIKAADFSLARTPKLRTYIAPVTTKRHFYIALWRPARLSTSSPASLNGSSGP
jgi:hypothetical protein